MIQILLETVFSARMIQASLCWWPRPPVVFRPSKSSMSIVLMWSPWTWPCRKWMDLSLFEKIHCDWSWSPYLGGVSLVWQSHWHWRLPVVGCQWASYAEAFFRGRACGSLCTSWCKTNTIHRPKADVTMKEQKLQIFLSIISQLFWSVRWRRAFVADTPYLLENNQPKVHDYTGVIGISGGQKGVVYFSATLPVAVFYIGQHGWDR